MVDLKCIAELLLDIFHHILKLPNALYQWNKERKNFNYYINNLSGVPDRLLNSFYDNNTKRLKNSICVPFHTKTNDNFEAEKLVGLKIFKYNDNPNTLCMIKGTQYTTTFELTTRSIKFLKKKYKIRS